jgi:hypothetical protein
MKRQTKSCQYSDSTFLNSYRTINTSLTHVRDSVGYPVTTGTDFRCPFAIPIIPSITLTSVLKIQSDASNEPTWSYRMT